MGVYVVFLHMRNSRRGLTSIRQEETNSVHDNDISPTGFAIIVWSLPYRQTD
jgi:hypothetical protein